LESHNPELIGHNKTHNAPSVAVTLGSWKDPTLVLRVAPKPLLI
jgi:hypothetical protein